VLPDTNHTWIVFGGKEGELKEGGRGGGRKGGREGGREGGRKSLIITMCCPTPITPGSCLAARKVM